MSRISAAVTILTTGTHRRMPVSASNVVSRPVWSRRAYQDRRSVSRNTRSSELRFCIGRYQRPSWVVPQPPTLALLNRSPEPNLARYAARGDPACSGNLIGSEEILCPYLSPFMRVDGTAMPRSPLLPLRFRICFPPLRPGSPCRRCPAWSTNRTAAQRHRNSPPCPLHAGKDALGTRRVLRSPRPP